MKNRQYWDYFNRGFTTNDFFSAIKTNKLLYCSSSVRGWKTFFFLAVMSLPVLAFAQNKTESWDNREQCLKGVTISCLTAGIEERKAGDLESALDYFRLACESHPVVRDFRACRPYFSLAIELGSLDSAVESFENQCRDGDDLTCFYLAKEFLNITAYERAHIVLERLCNERFSPSDAEELGPCYQLGVSYLRTHSLSRAKEIFRFDCKESGDPSLPSCERYEELSHGEKVLSFLAWHSNESFLVLIVLTPAFQWILLRCGLILGLNLAFFGGPVLVVAFFALWLGNDGFRESMHWYFIFPSFFLTLWISWLARGRWGFSSHK